MKRIKSAYTSLIIKVKKHPLRAFGGLLLILVLTILAGEFLRDDVEEVTPEATAIMVSTYPIGTASTMQVVGKVEESGSVTIVAQTGGIVGWLGIREGQAVNQGSALVRLNTNYAGNNIQSLQRQLASQQYNHASNTLEEQKALIEKQRELARVVDENSDQLREISQQSIDESQDQLSLNESILATLDSNLASLEQATQSAENDALILSTKQLKSQSLAAVNQLKQLIRQTEYQSSDDEPPAELSEIQREIALKQLDLQQKSIELGVEVSRLNFLIAAVNASLTAPTSPIAGVIDRVYVRQYQAVQPGQPLVRLSGDTTQLDVIVSLSQNVANRISRSEPATITIGGKQYTLMPQHITLEPLEDSQFRAYYHLPLEAGNTTFDGQYVSVKIPLGYPSTTATIPNIPVDSVYQLQGEAFVYLVKEGKAQAQSIILGNVIGGTVEVLEGLSVGDTLITTRNVSSGDQVQSE